MSYHTYPTFSSLSKTPAEKNLFSYKIVFIPALHYLWQKLLLRFTCILILVLSCSFYCLSPKLPYHECHPSSLFHLTDWSLSFPWCFLCFIMNEGISTTQFFFLFFFFFTGRYLCMTRVIVVIWNQSDHPTLTFILTLYLLPNAILSTRMKNNFPVVLWKLSMLSNFIILFKYFNLLYFSFEVTFRILFL